MKVAVLAERGVGGERQQAKKILAKSLARYGVTLAELRRDDSEKIIKKYPVKNKLAKKLLCQVASCVINSGDIKHRWLKSGKSVEIFLTETQHIEVDAMYSYYLKLLEGDINLLYIAFVNKHDIFCDAGRTRSANNRGDDGMDGKSVLDMMNISRGLGNSSYRKQLKGVKN